jgi:hypothetical protein
MSRVKKIQELIEQHGLTDASKITGLPRYELVRITDYPINHEIANMLLWDLNYDNLLPTVYKNCEISIDSFDGVFYWYYKGSNDEKMSTMATPFWDGSTTTPVESIEYEIDGNEIDGNYYNDLKSRSEFDSIEDLLTWYKHFYLPKVYNLVMGNLERFRNLVKNKDL